MKKSFITLVIALAACTLTAQEQKIKFNKGTVEICSSAKFTISGYNGNEVVIKSNSPQNTFYRLSGNTNNLISGQHGLQGSSPDSVRYVFNTHFGKDKEEKSKGLTPLGSSKDETAINSSFDIQEVGNRLLIRDKSYESQSNVLFFAHNSYEILIPNSVKLMLDSGKCVSSGTQNFIFSSDALKVADFSGDLQISSKYKAIELTDVSGPALINTLGGDVKVVFDKSRPDALFNIISNDGDIDISLPNNAKISASITGQEVLSNLDFKIISEDIANNQKLIRAELNGGGKKFDVRTEYGTVYLRKK